MSKKKKRKPVMLEFVDNKGNKIHLPDNLTMEDLVKLGVKHVGLLPKGAPIPDHNFVHPA